MSVLKNGALFLIALLGLASSGTAGAPTLPEVVINVDTQELALLRAGQEVARFPVSTSKFGLGDDLRSYKTPVGLFQVCEKSGESLPLGAVIKKGRFTGEVLVPDAPGRDPIVTRMIRLQGLEARNKHTMSRGIFIHGTPEERRIGEAVSWGCIRMRSKDVAELYKQVRVGTRVVICGTGHQKTSLEKFTAWTEKLWTQTVAYLKAPAKDAPAPLRVTDANATVYAAEVAPAPAKATPAAASVPIPGKAPAAPPRAITLPSQYSGRSGSSADRSGRL